MFLTVRPSRVAGTIAVPGSKSHTIRGIAAALSAPGECRLRRPLVSDDTLSVLHAAEALGMQCRIADGDWFLTGGQCRSGQSLDLGNSGTGLRFLTALAGTVNGTTRLDGDDSLRSRPMAGLLSALEQLGCSTGSAAGNAPVSVTGPMKGGKAKVDGKTSQFLSALLFAAPRAEQDCEFELDFLNEQPYVGLTLDWLKRLGIRVEASFETLRFRVPAGQTLRPFDVAIPADFSTALFPLAAGMIAGDGLVIEGLDFSDVQGDKAIFDCCAAMGAVIDRSGERTVIGRSGACKGGAFDLNATPDALPVMAAVAATIPDETRLLHVPQARIKETDRIRCMTLELTKMGAEIEELPDGMIIHGGHLHGACVEGYGDHRIVMALAVAALAAEGETRIAGAEAAAVTYPGFIGDFKAIGADFSIQE